jgi:hypothetical protein
VANRVILRKISRAVAVIMAAAAVVTVVVSTPAMAESSRRQTILDSLVAANAGARQVTADTVELPSGASVRVANGPECPAGRVCINDGWKYSGIGLQFFECDFWNLGEAGWGDRIRSYANEQWDHAVTKFMNWTGSSWDVLRESRAPDGEWWSDDSPRSVHWSDGIVPC